MHMHIRHNTMQPFYIEGTYLKFSCDNNSIDSQLTLAVILLKKSNKNQ